MERTMSEAMEHPGSFDLPDDDGEDQQEPYAFPDNAPDLMALDVSDWIHLWARRGVAGTITRDYHGPLHEAYEVDKSSYDTKHAAFRAWRTMKFPRLGGPHTDAFADSPNYGREYPARAWGGRVYARLKNPAWMQCLAHPDGSGIVTYGGEVAYVRTRNRLLLKASEDLKLHRGSHWFGGYTHPPHTDHDGALPLANLDELDGAPPLVDIVRYEKGGGNVYVHYDGGTTVVVLDDQTSNSRDNRKAGFVLASDDAADTTLPPASEAERLVMPAAVEEQYLKGAEIVTSDDYATRHTYRSADGWRHRETGDHIVRQGEWYLVPKHPWWSPNQPIYKPLNKPEREFDWDYDHLHGHDNSTKKDGECMCGATGSWHLPNNAPVWCCRACDSIFVSSGKHLFRVEEPINKQDFLDANERLDSHTPRDLSLDDDGTPVVRGTFRHVDNEHAMLNVGDRWHEVHENTRDMTVFSYRRGNYQTRSAGGMRVE